MDQTPSNMTGVPSAGAAPQIQPTGVHPRIGPAGFTAGIFTVLAISILTIIARVTLRLQRTKRLEGDDYFLIVALCLIIVAAAIQQYYRDLTYLVLNVELGNIYPGQDFVEGSPLMAVILDVTSVLLWTSIFCVKFSFLFFFRKLLVRVRHLMVFWWAVSGFVVVSALVCIPLGFIECPYFGPNFLAHCPVDELIKREHIYLNVTIVLDIFTDVLIISLPIALLWNVKIEMVKKFTLLGIFSLSMVMIIVALIRVTMAPLVSNIIDTTWLFFWQILEASIALLMVSVSAFRGLFGQSRHHPAYGSGHYRSPQEQKNSGQSKSTGDSSLVPGSHQNIRISSPRSPKTLATFTPMRSQPDFELVKGVHMSNNVEPVSVEGESAAIELKAVSSTSAYSRSQSQTRDYSPSGSFGSKRHTTFSERQKDLPPSPYNSGSRAGSASPGGTVSAHVWSDNDKRERSSSNRNSRWDIVRGTRNDGRASRDASRNRDAQERQRGMRSVSIEAQSRQQASKNISRAPSQGEHIIQEKERERGERISAKDHDRSRNGSNSTANAAGGHERVNPEELV